MRIIAVNGGPHQNGNSAALMRQVLQGASDSGAETEEIFLKDYNIQFCEGCMKCMELGHCVLDDDLEKLKAKVYSADGIILCSPSYGIMPTARMKNFLIDRLGMLAVYTSGLSGKYFVGISTAGGIGASKVAKDLAKTFAVGFFRKSYVSGYLGVVLAKDFTMNSVEKQPEKLRKAYNLGVKLATDIRKKNKYPFQFFLEHLFVQNVVARIIKKNIRHNGNGMLKAVPPLLREKGIDL